MPGKQLNRIEEKLDVFWNTPPTAVKQPYLRQIMIQGGLRAFSDGLLLPFRYPLVAIAGVNGSGKTTASTLAALGYRLPSTWTPVFRKFGSWTSQKSELRMADFFRYSRDIDPHSQEGLEVTWTNWYERAEQQSSLKHQRNRKWKGHSQRPAREVEILGLSRVTYPGEFGGATKGYSSKWPQSSKSLSPDCLEWMSAILGKRYTEVCAALGGGLSLLQCEANGTRYSGLNMGAGELSVCSIMFCVDNLSAGGLLVIDEVEAGLHPLAQRRIAEELIKVCSKKKIQVVCTTHSADFLDRIPRSARLLLRSSGGVEHRVVEGPTTRHAMYEMTGTRQSELIIYCEDDAAKGLLNAALSAEQRVRAEVIAVGSKTDVIRTGFVHAQRHSPEKALCVLDGEVTESEVKQWLNSERGSKKGKDPGYVILPGGTPPERWLMNELSERSEYRERLADRLGADVAQVERWVREVLAVKNHHVFAHEFAEKVGLEAHDCYMHICSSVIPRNPGMAEVLARVSALLG